MSFFLRKLIPPRPAFARDMTEAEARVMQEHVAYWTHVANKEIFLSFAVCLLNHEMGILKIP
jgi:hypothetical protein